MIRQPFLSSARIVTCAAAAAALWPVAVAAAPPGGFTLPEPTPSPSPAPAGPADERAGIAIPPRSQPAPRIIPAPMLTPEPEPAPRPLALPSPKATSTAAPTTTPAPTATTAPTVSAEPAAANAPMPTPDGAAQATEDTAQTLPTDATATDDSPVAASASDPVGKSVFVWASAAGAIVLLILAAVFAMLAIRRRGRRVPRLAPPPAGLMDDDNASVSDLPRFDLTLDIIGATRSVMMFSLQYRLTLANRTGRAFSDLGAAVQIECARRGGGNAPSPGAAQQRQTIDRIGPHQSRSITGTVQLPLADIAVLRQGSAAMFIPLAHVTIAAEGQSALTGSFVIGTPSAGGAGKLHPILLDAPPGSIPGLRAQSIAIPSVSAAA